MSTDNGVSILRPFETHRGAVLGGLLCECARLFRARLLAAQPRGTDPTFRGLLYVPIRVRCCVGGGPVSFLSFSFSFFSHVLFPCLYVVISWRFVVCRCGCMYVCDVCHFLPPLCVGVPTRCLTDLRTQSRACESNQQRHEQLCSSIRDYVQEVSFFVVHIHCSFRH